MLCSLMSREMNVYSKPKRFDELGNGSLGCRCDRQY